MIPRHLGKFPLLVWVQGIRKSLIQTAPKIRASWGKAPGTLLLILLLALVGPLAAQQPLDPPPDFPLITMDFVSDEAAPGFIYLANIGRAPAEETGTGRYLMVLDNLGRPVFIHPVEPPPFNFGRAPTGQMYYYHQTERGPGAGASMDGAYRIIDPSGAILQEYTAQGDALPTQGHDFLLLENGNALVISQPIHLRDLTAFDGHHEALVAELILQELDPDLNVVFEWRSWEHVELADTARPDLLLNEPPAPVAYFHGNGIALDLDGNYIISARRFDELIKIDRQSGKIIWRMGGGASTGNEFTFIDDPLNGFSGQHHAQILPNGNLLIFDNGDLHDPPLSRAVEYEIDEANRTARLVWSYDQGRYAGSMGSVQRLANGNTFIGWGSAPGSPSATEVTPDGRVVFALSLPEDQMSFRAYRYDFGDR